MPVPVLTKTRIHGGAWEGVLQAQGAAPRLEVIHGERRLDGVTLTAAPGAPGRWAVRVPIPAESLADGIQSFVIQDANSGAALASFAVAVGDVAEAGIRAEVDLLRAELEMLKRAFRRHCAAGD